MNGHQPGVSKRISAEEMTTLMKEALIGLGEILILDEEGRMVYISDEYAKNMNISIEDSLDKPIQEVVENTVLTQVLHTGKATLGATFIRNGDVFFVNRVPIKRDGKVVGVVAQAILNSRLHVSPTVQRLEGFVRELNYYKEKYKQAAVASGDLGAIVGNSMVMTGLKDMVRIVAGTRSTVLLTGESGTGKEVFAGAIHNLSARAQKPFVRINCAAIPDNLLESELFGYEEGAFTGAVKGGKIGDFEAANGGTVFLDEVNSLSPNMQAKLLRVIQEREIKKVGSTKVIPIDVRFIFATNKDLYQMVQEGSFREDFYYRINVVNLQLPPLRKRTEDILPLVDSFIQKFNKEMGKNISGLEPMAMILLENYSWPGNIRELENCIERAFNYHSGNGPLSVEDIKLPGMEDSLEHTGARAPLPTLREVRAQAETMAIRKVMQHCGGNKSEAAQILGIDRSILYEKLKRYGI